MMVVAAAAMCSALVDVDGVAGVGGLTPGCRCVVADCGLEVTLAFPYALARDTTLLDEGVVGREASRAR